MMSSRMVNVSFIGLLSVSLLVLIGAFLTWNDPRTHQITEYPSIEQFSVERCDLGSRYQYVSGWLHVPELYYARYRVYAELQDGEFILLETFSVSRPDIQQRLGLGQHQVSGFDASHRSLKALNFTGRITVQAANNYKEDQYSAQFICQK